MTIDASWPKNGVITSCPLAKAQKGRKRVAKRQYCLEVVSLQEFRCDEDTKIKLLHMSPERDVAVERLITLIR